MFDYLKNYLKYYYYQYESEDIPEFIFGIIMIIIGFILYYKTINLSHSGFILIVYGTIRIFFILLTFIYRYIRDLIYYIKSKKGDNK